MKLDELLEYDNKSACMNSFYNSFNVWFYIRNKVLTDIISLENNVTPSFSSSNKSLKEQIKFIYLSFIHKIPTKSAKIIFFSNNVVNMKNKNLYENRLCDYFFSQVEKNAMLIEDSYNFQYRRPRKVKVYYTGYIDLLYRIKKRFIRINNNDYFQIASIIEQIKNSFPEIFDQEYWEELKKIAFNGFNYFLFRKSYFNKMFTKINPKIIFREDASYGGYQDLALICRQKGIIFAELQHGYVGMDHTAYNYGNSFFKNEILRVLLPEYYLTFGIYWGEQIRHPAKKISIGFPYLQMKSNVNLEKNLILIISDGDSPNQNKELISYIKEYTIENNLKILLKLHPCEASKINDWYSDLIKDSLISIKIYEPVYDYIPNSRFVIGSGSTVMYETLCFGINPFVYESKRFLSNTVAKEIFDTFKTKEELLQLMNGKRGLKTIKYDCFFDKNWQNSFLDFINSL